MIQLSASVGFNLDTSGGFQYEWIQTFATFCDIIEQLLPQGGGHEFLYVASHAFLGPLFGINLEIRRNLIDLADHFRLFHD